MKISIITATFDSQKTVEQNAQSVISQNYKDFEHIIVDNLSSDETLKIIKDIYSKNGLTDKLRILSEKDEGIADAFNKGIKLSHGEIINFLNSDDHYFDDSVFSKIIEAFNDKNVLVVHGNIYFEDTTYGSNIRRPPLCPVTEAMPYNHPTMFFRKSVFEQLGYYDVSYKYSMDFELVCRLEKELNGLDSKTQYIEGNPLVSMYSGGASWKNEVSSIRECKLALIKHGFWNYDAKKNYSLRILRTNVKEYLNKLNLNMFVKFWRNKKWR